MARGRRGRKRSGGGAVMDHKAIVTPRVTYEAWTNGYAAGFKCIHNDGRVVYVLLNPSDDYGTSMPDPDFGPDVFLYIGPHGDPARDECQDHYYLPFDPDQRYWDKDAEVSYRG